MKRKNSLEMWQEDGGIELMKDFFDRVEATPEEKERIKEMAWAKVAAEPAGLRSEAESAPEYLGWKDAEEEKLRLNPAGRVFAQVKVLWWHWRWKLALPLAALLLLWAGWGQSNHSLTNAPITTQHAAVQASGAVNTTGHPGAATGAPGGVTYGAAAPGSQAMLPAGAANSKNTVAFTSAALADAAVQNALPRKITQNLTLEVRVAQVQSAIGQVSAEAAKLGGYVVDMQQTDAGSDVSGHITLKVPAGKLQDMQGMVAGLGKVLNQHLTSSDLTDQYNDTQTLLANWQAEEKQYVKILAQAHTVEEILKVENALSNVRGQIRLLEGRLKLMNNQVDYATIDLQLVPLPNPNVMVGNPWQPMAWSATWQAVKAAFIKTLSGSWNAFNYLLIGLGYTAPYAILAAGLWLLYHFWTKSRPKK